MRTHFAGNNRIIICVCLGILALAAGCATTPKQTVWAPVFLENESRAVIQAGALAMSECSRERVQARLENRVLKFEKFQIFSPQMDCSLNGDIMLVDEFKNSPVNLTGEIIISGRKVKMNITIEGTIANPSIRYM